MRIGIDCRTILSPSRGEKAGIGHYTYYLVNCLLKIDKANEYVLFFDYRVPDVREFEQKNVKAKYFPFSQYKKFLPFTYSHMLIAARLAREKLDVYHSPANVIPYLYSGPSIVTVHDLAIYKNPDWFPSGQKFSTKFLVPKSLRKAKRIIAVSEATKKDIIKLFKIPASKITVIHEGVVVKKLEVRTKDIKAKDRYNLSDKYICFVGTLEPRKNVLRLIEAYADFLKKSKKFQEYDLVIAGTRGWRSREIFNLIKRLKLKDKVKYLDYIPNNLKLDLIENATCFVFPSLYEGFGLPVLEAMKLGTPVITSNVSSLPEITNSAAILVNPCKASEIAKALEKVIKNKPLREKLKKAGLEQAKKFDWEKFARKTLSVYKEVYSQIQKDKKQKAKKVKK